MLRIYCTLKIALINNTFFFALYQLFHIVNIENKLSKLAIFASFDSAI